MSAAVLNGTSLQYPTRRIAHRAAWLAVVVLVLLWGQASAEVYWTDVGFEISGTGSRASRNCTILLKPTMTLGDELAPQLVMITAGRSRLSFGVRNPGQYANAVIVQDNERKPLVGADNVEVGEFRLAEIVKVLRSQRLFFVTARNKSTGKYVSSRYEHINYDAIMSKVEDACPFDGESLMTDLSERERAERSLSITQSDLNLIRWALNKKYGGASGEPEQRITVSPTERGYLKRYAADNALPMSQYLTANSARRLISDGQLIAKEAKKFVFEVCNRSLHNVALAIVGRKNVDATDWTLAGWLLVDSGSCKKMGSFARGNIYAVALVRNERKGWFGKDIKYCVEPTKFERIVSSTFTCPSNGFVIGFREFNITGENYTWSIEGPPSFDEQEYFSFEVCNRTAKDASIAVAGRKIPGGDWTVEGWWTVNAGSCKTIGRFAKRKFYASGKVPGKLEGWYGTDVKQCVEFPGPFERVDRPNVSCPSGNSGKVVGFHEFNVMAEKYTWALEQAPVLPADEFFAFEVCNNSGNEAFVAMSYRSTDADTWIVEGWSGVKGGQCRVLGNYRRGYFFHYATVSKNRGEWGGKGNETGSLCITLNSNFRRVHTAGYSCKSKEVLKKFRQTLITASTYKWTLGR